MRLGDLRLRTPLTIAQFFLCLSRPTNGEGGKLGEARKSFKASSINKATTTLDIAATTYISHFHVIYTLQQSLVSRTKLPHLTHHHLFTYKPWQQWLRRAEALQTLHFACVLPLFHNRPHRDPRGRSCTPRTSQSSLLTNTYRTRRSR